MRARVALCALVVVCVLAGAQQATALGADEFSEDVREARIAAEQVEGESLTQREATDLAIRVNSLVPAMAQIDTPDGTKQADNSVLRTLVSRLDAAETAEERSALAADMAAYLRSLEQALGEPGQVVAYDDAALRALLEEQAPARRSPFAEYFAELVDRMGRALERWWASVGGSPTASTTMTTVTFVVLTVLLLILAIVVVRVVAYMRSGTSKRAGAASPTVDEAAVIEAAVDLPADALVYADERAAAGEYREALRALLGGSARELQVAGYLVEVRTRTNRELVAEVGSACPGARDPLTRLVTVFEKVFYGHREPDASQFAAARDDLLSIRRVIARELPGEAA